MTEEREAEVETGIEIAEREIETVAREMPEIEIAETETLMEEVPDPEMMMERVIDRTEAVTTVMNRPVMMPSLLHCCHRDLPLVLAVVRLPPLFVHLPQVALPFFFHR